MQKPISETGRTALTNSQLDVEVGTCSLWIGIIRLFFQEQGVTLDLDSQK